MDQQHLCRLCGKVENELINIFSKDCRGIQYINKIRKCIPIVIYRTDPLSKFICEECSVTLNEFYQYQFKILCTHNEAVESIRHFEQNKSTQLYLSTCDSSQLTMNENGHSDLDQELDESEIENKKGSIRLLTPQKINAKLTNGDINHCEPQSANESFSDVKTESPVVHQPKTLLQYALHNINLAINPTYQQEIEPIEFKSNASRAVSRPRKKMLSKVMPIFNKLLRSPNLNIKKIKLEYNDPAEPEITIKLRSPNVVSDDSNDNLIVTHATHKVCKYCRKHMDNINELALHEQQHIHVFLGARIDSNYWRDYEENMFLRNKWIDSHSQQVLESDNEDQDDSQNYIENGDVDVDVEVDVDYNDTSMQNNHDNDNENENGSTEENETEDSSKKENDTENEANDNGNSEPKYPIEGVHVNGVPFLLIDKLERYKYYKKVTVNGLTRKVCPFCENDYFNSTAVDYHLRKNRCIKMCRFCNLTFPRDDLTYYTHLNEHRGESNFYKLTKFDRKQYQDILRKKKREERESNPTAPVEQENRVEPIKMKYLLQKQNCVTIKSEPDVEDNNTATNNSEYESKRVENKPPRTFYCRKCYKVFYQQEDLNAHFPNCLCDMGSSDEDDEDEIPSGRLYPMSMPQIYQEPQYNTTPIEKSDSYPCHLCPRSFASSYSRNSHMRIHVNNPNYDAPFNQMLNQNQVTITPVQKAIANRQGPLPPAASKSIKYDENLARLAQNPQITIRPSVKKRSAEDMNVPEQPVAIKQIKLEHDDVRRYRCLPCGQYFSSKSILYEHKKTCNRPTSNYVEMPVETKTAPEDFNKRFRCVPCNKRFSTNKALYLHKKSVCMRDKVFECPFCQRKFTTESQYTTHILYNHPE